ncbi:hypothetical protein PG985_005544 [Apiospora marii]|uniref:uncharacterized protein n=1 Tax=Apiospora marii TaxID=335849 RepID=UPI00312D3505
MSRHSISDVLTKFEALLCQFEDDDIHHEDAAMEFSRLYLRAQEYYSSLDYPYQLKLMAEGVITSGGPTEYIATLLDRERSLHSAEIVISSDYDLSTPGRTKPPCLSFAANGFWTLLPEGKSGSRYRGRAEPSSESPTVDMEAAGESRPTRGYRVVVFEWLLQDAKASRRWLMIDEVPAIQCIPTGNCLSLSTRSKAVLLCRVSKLLSPSKIGWMIVATRLVCYIAVFPDLFVIGKAPPAKLGLAFVTRHMIAPARLLNTPTASSPRTRPARLFDFLHTGRLLHRSSARACTTIIFRTCHTIVPQDVVLKAGPSSTLDAPEYWAGTSMQLSRAASGRDAPMELGILGKSRTENLAFISLVYPGGRKCLDVAFTQSLVTFWARKPVVATALQP